MSNESNWWHGTNACGECERGFAEHFDIILGLGEDEVLRNLCGECLEHFRVEGQIIEDPSIPPKHLPDQEEKET